MFLGQTFGLPGPLESDPWGIIAESDQVDIFPCYCSSISMASLPWAMNSDLMLPVKCCLRAKHWHQQNLDGEDMLDKHWVQSRDNFICKQTFRHFILMSIVLPICTITWFMLRMEQSSRSKSSLLNSSIISGTFSASFITW